MWEGGSGAQVSDSESSALSVLEEGLEREPLWGNDLQSPALGSPRPWTLQSPQGLALGQEPALSSWKAP